MRGRAAGAGPAKFWGAGTGAWRRATGRSHAARGGMALMGRGGGLGYGRPGIPGRAVGQTAFGWCDNNNDVYLAQR